MCDYIYVVFFFFKQKTAYEMRISDWSSDVCSSDLMRSRSGVRSDGVGPAAPASCFSGLSGRRIFRLPGNAQGDHSMRWLLSKRGGPIPMTDLWAVGAVSIKSVWPLFPIHLLQFPPQAKAAILSGRPRSEEHTSELQSHMRISYAVTCLTNHTKQQYQ